MLAITTPVAGEVDLDDVAAGDGYLFVRDGVGVAGRGVAARVPIDDAVAFLAAIEHDDRVGGTPGPIAIGAVPFLPGSPADLVVPELIVVRDRHGRTWRTEVRAAGEPTTGLPHEHGVADPASGAPDRSHLPGGFSIRPGVPVEHYLEAVAAARDAVRAGRMAKAVIARPIVIESDVRIDVHAVLLRLRANFGSSHRFSIDGFIGASPELLVEVDGDVVRSHPLAGTTRTTGDPELDAKLAAELHASAKNRIEHEAAIAMVRDTLLPFCSYLDWAPEPSIVKVANVQHLGSQAEGRLSRPVPTVVELVRALQPTPAVGGHPREAAIELITAVEGFERGPYGGTVGWVDAQGNGTWAVSLRCAELSDDRRCARLVAGGGIVADSEPLSELAETQAKFQAMLSAIVRP